MRVAPIDPEIRRKCTLRFLELVHEAGIEDIEAQVDMLGDVLLAWRNEATKILRTKQSLSEDEIRKRAKELMARYSSRGQEIIRQYFRALANTRKTKKISPKIVVEEMQYWERFPEEIVIEALTIHLARYTDRKEAYTRGIMRGEYERHQRFMEEREKLRAKEAKENGRLLEKYKAREQEVWGEDR